MAISIRDIRTACEIYNKKKGLSPTDRGSLSAAAGRTSSQACISCRLVEHRTKELIHTSTNSGYLMLQALMIMHKVDNGEIQ